MYDSMSEIFLLSVSVYLSKHLLVLYPVQNTNLQVIVIMSSFLSGYIASSLKNNSIN